MVTLSRVSLTCIGIGIGVALVGCAGSVDEQQPLDEVAGAEEQASTEQANTLQTQDQALEVASSPQTDEENIATKSDAFVGWGGGWGGRGWGWGGGWGRGWGWGAPGWGWGGGWGWGAPGWGWRGGWGW